MLSARSAQGKKQSQQHGSSRALWQKCSAPRGEGVSENPDVLSQAASSGGLQPSSSAARRSAGSRNVEPAKSGDPLSVMLEHEGFCSWHAKSARKPAS